MSPGPHVSQESSTSRMPVSTDSGHAPRLPVLAVALLSFIVLATGAAIGMLSDSGRRKRKGKQPMLWAIGGVDDWHRPVIGR